MILLSHPSNMCKNIDFMYFEGIIIISGSSNTTVWDEFYINNTFIT
jgi:hypothetical protein